MALPAYVPGLPVRDAALAEFRRSHSAGELWLQDQADPEVPTNPGSPKAWVEKGHIQHLTFVAGHVREQDV